VRTRGTANKLQSAEIKGVYWITTDSVLCIITVGIIDS